MSFAHKIFFILSGGFTSGIFFRSFFDFGIFFSVFVVFISVILLLQYFFIEQDRQHKSVLFVALFIVGLFLGVLRFDISSINEGSDLMDKYLNERIVLSGVIIDEPDVRENNTRIIIKPREIIDTAGLNLEIKNPSTAKIITIIEQYPKYTYGDIIEISGALKEPANFTTDTGREFNYVDFLNKDGVYYSMFYPEIELVGADGGNPIRSTLFNMKHSFLGSISNVIPEPHASLLGGLVVGAKQSLGEDILDDFRATGIIHIVVLSGYNVTIVAEAIMRFFSFLPQNARLILGASSILGFMVMVGAGATVVRASIMALIVVFARATGRMKEITIALLAAGVLMLLFNPRILVFDPSFQLSFLATIGLIYLAPSIERYFKLIPTVFQFREFAVATISTQIFVLPLLLYMTGQFSIVALPVNLLVLFAIPATMLFGFLAGTIGLFSSILALPFSVAAYLLLEYELKIVELFATLPFASVNMPNISFWLVVILYFVYIAILFKINKK